MTINSRRKPLAIPQKTPLHTQSQSSRAVSPMCIHCTKNHDAFFNEQIVRLEIYLNTYMYYDWKVKGYIPPREKRQCEFIHLYFTSISHNRLETSNTLWQTRCRGLVIVRICWWNLIIYQVFGKLQGCLKFIVIRTDRLKMRKMKMRERKMRQKSRMENARHEYKLEKDRVWKAIASWIVYCNDKTIKTIIQSILTRSIRLSTELSDSSSSSGDSLHDTMPAGTSTFDMPG